jgi:hypothetical protein
MKSAWAALTVFSLAACVHAETNQDRGKRIVDQALEALGGKAFLGMKDRTETGRAYSFYRDRLTGLSIAKIYTRYYPPDPGKLTQRERQTFGKKEESIVLLLEDEGYTLSYRGARPLPKDRIERYRESAPRNVLYILHQRINEPGMIFDYKSSDIFENAPVEVVDITDSSNRTTTVYFHRTTHLPIRQSFVWRDAETKETNEEVTRFTKYRDVGGGAQWPFNVLRERNGEKVFEIFSETITINNNLSEAMFSLPSGAKILPLK